MAKVRKIKKIVKPWGCELWYAQSPYYLGKIITIEKGKRLSLQYHKKKHETVYALRGRWLLRLGNTRRLMRPGMAMVIPPGAMHRFESPFGRVTLLEVSTAHPDDVTRIEDDFGRCK